MGRRTSGTAAVASYSYVQLELEQHAAVLRLLWKTNFSVTMADILCLNLKLEKIERKCDNERVEWICKLLQASSQFERFNSKM